MDIPLLGIGAHRSPLTHSIIAGVAAEMVLLSTSDFAALMCQKVPHEKRSPLWDEIQKFCVRAATGTSAGIAYHLVGDGVFQPAAYHGLPISMPMMAHEVILTGNGIVEATDAVMRERQEKLTLDEIEVLIKKTKRFVKHQKMLAKLKERRLAKNYSA